MDPQTTEQPPAPQPGRAARLWRWLGGVYSRTLGVLALALVAYFVFVEPPPIWPFATGGRIYVESPGVYTRERLVNDRYSQDFWLKTQLARLDASADLVREYRQSSFRLGGGAAPDAQTPTADPALPFQDDFLLRAAIRDKIRQMVLENLLDDRHDLTGNSIYGLKFETAIVPGANTRLRPYVVVRIGAETLPQGMTADQFLSDPTSAHNSATGGDFEATRRQYNDWRRNVETRLNGYLEQAAGTRSCAAPEPPAPSPALDARTVDAPPDLDKASAFDLAPVATPAAASATPAAAPAPPADGWAEVDRARIHGALRQVLGVEPRETSFAPWLRGGPFGTIDLPEPWSRYFQMQVWLGPDFGSGADDCAQKFFIQLKFVSATIMIIEKQEYDRYKKSATELDNQRIQQVSIRADLQGRESGDIRIVAIQQRQIGPFWQPSAAELSFVESLTVQDLDRLLKRKAPAGDVCLLFGSESVGQCLLRGASFPVNASQYDFIRAVAKSEPYSYAVFPRGDVEGVLTDRTLAGGVDGGGEGGALGLSGLLRTRTAGAEPVVVNFAGGRSPVAALGDFDFGWAVVRPGRQRPNQLSQLVLVSVPAYLDKLELFVETGWLDRNSDPIGAQPVIAEAAPPEAGDDATAASGQAQPVIAEAAAPPEAGDDATAAPGQAEIVETRVGERRITRMSVSLPPDYEAIDTLVVGGTRRQGPVIDDLYFTDRSPTVVACQRAEILIPGERLWRSTAVTLGGQIADRITVMPDMRGIVATFESVAMPAIPEGEQAEKLAVWTSEGRDELTRPMTIRVPKAAEGADRCPDWDVAIRE